MTDYLLFTFMDREANGAFEFEDALTAIGLEVEQISSTQCPGIVIAQVNEEGQNWLVLRDALIKESWRFSSLLKIARVSASAPIDSFEAALPELCKEANAAVGHRAYRLTVRRIKDGQLKRTLISALASCVNGQVDLNNFAVEVVMYNVGNRLYLVPDAAGYELSAEKVKRVQVLDSNLRFTCES